MAFGSLMNCPILQLPHAQCSHKLVSHGMNVHIAVVKRTLQWNWFLYPRVVDEWWSEQSLNPNSPFVFFVSKK